MEKLQSWMEEHLLPVANKIASNKYLKAISSGMISIVVRQIKTDKYIQIV